LRHSRQRKSNRVTAVGRSIVRLSLGNVPFLHRYFILYQFPPRHCNIDGDCGIKASCRGLFPITLFDIFQSCETLVLQGDSFFFIFMEMGHCMQKGAFICTLPIMAPLKCFNSASAMESRRLEQSFNRGDPLKATAHVKHETSGFKPRGRRETRQEWQSMQQSGPRR